MRILKGADIAADIACPSGNMRRDYLDDKKQNIRKTTEIRASGTFDVYGSPCIFYRLLTAAWESSSEIRAA